MVVEAEHLGDQAGTKLERQLLVRRGGASRRLCDHVALERGQAARRVGQPRVQQIVELVARHDQRLSLGDVAQRARENRSRRARRDDDGDGFAAVRVRALGGSGFRVGDPEPDRALT